MCFLSECAFYSIVHSIRMCMLSKCAFFLNVHSIQMCFLSKCAFYPNVHSFRVCILSKCAFYPNVHDEIVHKYVHRVYIVCTFVCTLYGHCMHMVLIHSFCAYMGIFQKCVQCTLLVCMIGTSLDTQITGGCGAGAWEEACKTGRSWEHSGCVCILGTYLAERGHVEDRKGDLFNWPPR